MLTDDLKSYISISELSSGKGAAKSGRKEMKGTEREAGKIIKGRKANAKRELSEPPSTCAFFLLRARAHHLLLLRKLPPRDLTWVIPIQSSKSVTSQWKILFCASKVLCPRTVLMTLQ